jgi:hypothetical protein
MKTAPMTRHSRRLQARSLVIPRLSGEQLPAGLTFVGRTPASARVPLALYAKRTKSPLRTGQTGASAADQGVRPGVRPTNAISRALQRRLAVDIHTVAG